MSAMLFENLNLCLIIFLHKFFLQFSMSLSVFSIPLSPCPPLSFSLSLSHYSSLLLHPVSMLLSCKYHVPMYFFVCANCASIHMTRPLDRFVDFNKYLFNLIKFLSPQSSRPSPDSDIPVIRVPKALQNKVQTIQQGQKRGPVKLKGRIFTARPGTEIISSKNKEYNHYLNQTYEKLSPPKLTSQGWKSSRSKGDYFTILAYKGVSGYYCRRNVSITYMYMAALSRFAIVTSNFLSASVTTSLS